MEISNVGASLKITNGSNSVDVIKANILFVEVIKTNIIKIDIGAGPLHNFFIPYTEVTLPVTATPSALRDAILAMLGPSVGSNGSATEANQLAELAALNTVITTLSSINTISAAIEDKTFNEPLLLDDGQPNLYYEGYAPVGSRSNSAVWAIKRTQHLNGVDVKTWAAGNKNFTNIWDARETLIYS